MARLSAMQPFVKILCPLVIVSSKDPTTTSPNICTIGYEMLLYVNIASRYRIVKVYKCSVMFKLDQKGLTDVS